MECKSMKNRVVVFLVLVLFCTSFFLNLYSSQASSGYSFIILSRYNCNMKIGQSFFLAGIASNGKRITWKSSKSSIASVNTYGQVTAKKAGTCKIIGKVSGGEASCKITVERTRITLSAATLTMENGTNAILRATTSNGSSICWKSKKSSVASVDENGQIEAYKPGETIITAKADGSVSLCRVIVKKPKVTLNKTKVTMYRGESVALTAKVSSKRKVTWKSKKKSVATVTSTGKVTAIKHGNARITATVDGVTKECEITVKSPNITLNKKSVTIKKGKTMQLTAIVSSNNKPTWKSTKSSVATVSKNGEIRAKKKGTCYIHVSEDGTKESCHVRVTA